MLAVLAATRGLGQGRKGFPHPQPLEPPSASGLLIPVQRTHGEDLFLLEDHLWHELGLSVHMHEHLRIKAELREPSSGVKDHLRKSKNLRFVYKMTL